ncbi:Acetylxylan esterase [Bertholletia excelsa]
MWHRTLLPSGNMLQSKMLAFLSIILLACAARSVSSVEPNNIFILAGQSNMSGRGGVVNNTWDGVVPPQCRPRADVLRLTADLKWTQAAEPLHRDIDVHAVCGVGPGMSFANFVLGKDPSLAVMGLVPCAVGGTSIREWQRGTVLYNQMKGRVSAAMRGGGTVRALLWYQGEADTLNSQDAELYKGRLERFFMDLRSDLQSSLFPIIQVGLASGQTPLLEKVREAQMAVDLENVLFVDAKGLPLEPDHVHLTTAAEARLGEKLGAAFLGTLPSPIHSAIQTSAPGGFHNSVLGISDPH